MFSKEEYAKLLDIWEKDQTLTIRGISACGDTFETKGKITVNDNGDPAIYQDWIMVEFGERHELRKHGRARSECYAPFSINFSSCGLEFGKGLMIFELEDEQKNKIYTNPKSLAIELVAKRNNEKLKQRQKQNGTELCEEDDKVTAQLKRMVGQPIELDGRKGVLLCVDGCNVVNGATTLSIAVGPLIAGIGVGLESELYWDDPLTDTSKWVVNNAKDTLKIFSKRLMHNKSNQKNTKNQEENENVNE